MGSSAFTRLEETLPDKETEAEVDSPASPDRQPEVVTKDDSVRSPVTAAEYDELIFRTTDGRKIRDLQRAYAQAIPGGVLSSPNTAVLAYYRRYLTWWELKRDFPSITRIENIEPIISSLVGSSVTPNMQNELIAQLISRAYLRGDLAMLDYLEARWKLHPALQLVAATYHDNEELVNHLRPYVTDRNLEDLLILVFQTGDEDKLEQLLKYIPYDMELLNRPYRLTREQRLVLLAAGATRDNLMTLLREDSEWINTKRIIKLMGAGVLGWRDLNTYIYQADKHNKKRLIKVLSLMYPATELLQTAAKFQAYDLISALLIAYLYTPAERQAAAAQTTDSQVHQLLIKA